MKGWNVFRLGDVCDFQGGSQPPKSTFSSVHKENYIRLIQIRDYKSDNYIVFIPKDKARRFCTKGDVMIGRYRPPIFQILRGIEGAYNVALMKAVPNESLLSKDFLFYFLKTPKIQHYIISLSARAAGQTGLNKSAIEPYLISLPSLIEQNRIVAIVDEAFEAIDIAIDNAKQNLTNACELFDSIISTVIFGDSLKNDWHSKTVADVILTKKGSIRTGPFGSQLLHSEFVDEGIAVLGIDNAVKNKFQWDKRRFITPEKYLQLSRYKVNPGDVLITIMGTCGRCAIVPDDIPVAINTKHLCCITLDKQKCLPGFLHAYFLYHPIAQQFLLKKAKGSIMAGLNMEIIKELPLQLPSIPTQQKIIEEVRSLSHETQRLKTTYQQKLTALNELKQSILHKAFTGELTADKADLKTNIEPEAICT
jgi:type I restriction enzyme, S subunit